MSKTSTFQQYPYPPEPSKWTHEERMYAQGLRRLFDILFSRKLQNALIADGAVTSRNIKQKSVALGHLVDGFGSSLDITENQSVINLESDTSTAQATADDAVADAAAAQRTADLATLDAAAAQRTADDAVADAAAAQSTADQAVLDAADAQQTADDAVADAAAAQSTADQAVQDAAAAQQTANGKASAADVQSIAMPVGITIIATAAPSFGTWSQTTVDSMTAWTRTA